MGQIKSKFVSLVDRGSFAYKRSRGHVNLVLEGVQDGNVSFCERIQNEPATIVKLSATHSKLKTIPADIGRFVNLKVLDLSNNLIEFIPWSIVYLKQLEILNLSHNQLKQLPSTMFHFPYLVSLDLSYNLFERLPNELLRLEKLEKLNVEGNTCLVSPPLDVCLRGVDVVFENLRKRKCRSDIWAGWRPYYKGELTSLKSLVEICIDSIIDSKLDYLSATIVPTTVKKYLASAQKFNQSSGPLLMKCSCCKTYFSKEDIFDNHVCFSSRVNSSPPRRGQYILT